MLGRTVIRALHRRFKIIEKRLQISPGQIFQLHRLRNAPVFNFVPIPLDTVATVVSTRGMFDDLNAPPQRLIFTGVRRSPIDGSRKQPWYLGLSRAMQRCWSMPAAGGCSPRSVMMAVRIPMHFTSGRPMTF